MHRLACHSLTHGRNVADPRRYTRKKNQPPRNHRLTHPKFRTKSCTGNDNAATHREFTERRRTVRIPEHVCANLRRVWGSRISRAQWTRSTRSEGCKVVKKSRRREEGTGWAGLGFPLWAAWVDLRPGPLFLCPSGGPVDMGNFVNLVRFFREPTFGTPVPVFHWK